MGGANLSELEFFPFAYAIKEEFLQSYCWTCLQDSKDRRRCTGCGFAVFCNKECQVLGWKDHKAECKGFRLCNNLPDIEVRMLGRIVLRHKVILSGKDKEEPDFYKNRQSKRTIMEIWAHVEKIKEDEYEMKKFDGIFTKLEAFYEKKFMLPRDVVFELHCRNYINRHAISDRDHTKEIAKGLYLDLCAYDHSCRPNVICTFSSTNAFLRKLDDSVDLLDKKNTFYTYIDTFSSHQERQKMLRETWYFDCKCARCQDPEDHMLTAVICPHCPASERVPVCIYGELAKKDPITSEVSCKQCENLLDSKYVVEALFAMRFIDRTLEDNEVEQLPMKSRAPFLRDLLHRFETLLPPINVYFCKIIQSLIGYVNPEECDELLRLHQMSESCVRHCFPKNHPALALHLRTTGHMATNCEKPKMAAKYLEEARAMLAYSLRSDHSMVARTDLLIKDNIDEEKRIENNLSKKVAEVSIKEKKKTEEKKSEVEAENDGDMPELINE